MKIIDRNGRLFGKISIVDVLVICVVLVMALALGLRAQRSAATVDNTPAGTTAGTKEYVPITCKMWVRGARTHIVDAIQVGDLMYEQGRNTGGAIGTITHIEKKTGTGLAEMPNGTIINAPMDEKDGRDLILTVECEGVVEDGQVYINGVYQLGVNAYRSMYTKYVSFNATVLEIY